MMKFIEWFGIWSFGTKINRVEVMFVRSKIRKKKGNYSCDILESICPISIYTDDHQIRFE